MPAPSGTDAARVAAIDSYRNGTAEEAQAALRHLEAQYAGLARELATIRASRAWRLAQALRGLVRRAAPRTAPPPARRDMSAWAPDAGTASPRVALIVLPAGGAAAAPPPQASLAGADCEMFHPDPADPVAGCNAAAAATRADRIVLWDGVSSPAPGWLPALADSLDRIEGAGMAGAMLLAPDGRIAAAGATIAPEGHLAPRGAGGDPDDPAHASVTPVEALPLGAVMLPASVWRQFGGLDATFGTPALALADLALRLRGAGLAVLCQPFARLRAPPPRPAEPGWTEALDRWHLRRRRAEGGRGLAAIGLAAAPPPRALFVDHLVPTPDRDGASVDIVLYLRAFVAFGYAATLLPVGDLARSGREVENLRRDGVRVVADGRAASAAAFLAGEAPFDLILLYRPSLAAGPLFGQLRAHSPRARLVYNSVDLHFVRMEREAMLEHSAEKLDAAFRAQQIELAAIARADCAILLSPAEQTLIAGLLPRAKTCVIPIARPVRAPALPFARRRGVVFVGGFRHSPNVDAVLAFVRDTWPMIRARLPLTFDIVGADPPDEIRALADPAAGIAVLGHVVDLDTLLDRSRLTVAPLRFGAGIKGKIVTSLAAGVPCVASPIAVEGMGLTDGAQIRVAATPEAFAEAVVAVHERQDVWTALSDSGLDFASRAFSVAEVRRHLAAMLDDLGLPSGRPAAP